MKRREFIRHAAGGMGAAWLGSSGLAAKRRFLASLGMTPDARLAALPGLPRKFAANETATIGKTGIQTSLLAMGTGTVGSGHHSHQTALGIKGLSDLLLNGYEHGLRFFDAADSYGSHPHVGARCGDGPRGHRAIPAGIGNGLPGHLLVMHCLTEGDWTDRYRGVMDVFEEARQKGTIRAHGCSCHSIEALRTATKSPWVQV